MDLIAQAMAQLQTLATTRPPLLHRNGWAGTVIQPARQTLSAATTARTTYLDAPERVWSLELGARGDLREVGLRGGVPRGRVRVGR